MATTTAPPVKARDWRLDVLAELGAPPTKENVQFLTAWQQWEGGHTNNRARFNWLNTTQGRGYPAINSVGVRAFPDYWVGIRYTVATLLNGRYAGIVEGLRAGRPTEEPYRERVARDLQVWVSGSPTGNPGYAAKVLRSAGAPFRDFYGWIVPLLWIRWRAATRRQLRS
jgi:hypothetical protein